MKQKIQLSQHFTYGKLLKFSFPSIVMMIFTSVYGVVDGLFVSNFMGKTAFASVNLIMPFVICTGAIGFMIGAGGSAIVGKTLGEGDKEKANRYFSMLVYVTIVLGVAVAALGLAVVRPIARLFGAEGELLEGCVTTVRFCLLSSRFSCRSLLSRVFSLRRKRPPSACGS